MPITHLISNFSYPLFSQLSQVHCCQTTSDMHLLCYMETISSDLIYFVSLTRFERQNTYGNLVPKSKKTVVISCVKPLLTSIVIPKRLDRETISAKLSLTQYAIGVPGTLETSLGDVRNR